MRKALLVLIVAMVAALAVGCRGGPGTVTVDPVPLLRAAGTAAVQVAVLSGEVEREQLLVLRPYVQAARDLAAAAPPERPEVIAELLLSAVPADSPDGLLLRAYIVDFCEAVKIQMPPEAEKAAAWTAAFLAGVDDAIGLLTVTGEDHIGKSAGALPA